MKNNVAQLLADTTDDDLLNATESTFISGVAWAFRDLRATEFYEKVRETIRLSPQFDGRDADEIYKSWCLHRAA
jgi:hypothetical protein